MESESTTSSPILRVTTDISEVKDSNECLKHSCHKPLSREGKNILQGNLYIKKKTLHPLHGCNPYLGRNTQCGSYISIQNAKSNVSTFTQRIMSAKLLRVKQLQNQLAETQSRVSELINENKLLKTLQRRQDYALKKYEGSQEQLPQLIKSHNEEIRVINAKFKQLKLNYKALENKLKERDTELMNLREQHKHLLKLSRDKQLGDREKLTKKLEEVEAHVKSQQEKIQLLTRKVELEGKSYRHRLNLEISKHKDTQAELREARKTIDNLKLSLEGKQKYETMGLSKKIVRPFVGAAASHMNQQSRISLPGPPPSVSIRQPQRLVNSETAVIRDDESDSDSFSFGLQNLPQNNEDDSCSDRSDSNGEEKLNHLDKIRDKSSNVLSGSSRLLNRHNFAGGSASLSSNNSRNSLTRSSPNVLGLKNVNYSKNMVRSSEKTVALENKLTGPRVNVRNPMKSEYKVETASDISIKDAENKIPPRNLSLKNSTRRNSLNIIPVEVINGNSRSTERRHSVTNSIKPSGSLESVKSTLSEKGNNNETSPKLEDDFLTNNYDHELSSIQTEIEKELGTILCKKFEEGGTISITNENSSNSMEAEIEELERKFRVFDMPQIRKETEDDINKIVDRACRSLEEEMNNEFRINATDEQILHNGSNNSLNEVKTDDDILSKLGKTDREVVNLQPDIMLGESQKANLLKALNNIDKDTNSNDDLSDIFQGKNENFNSNTLQRMQGYQHVGNLINNRSKKDVINKIFSEESTVSTK